MTPRWRVHRAFAAGILLLVLFAIDVVLRLALPPQRWYYVNEPGLAWTVASFPEAGQRQRVGFHINDSGIRGRPFGEGGAEYRVLAVGGSTTECPLLDDSIVWTHLLERGLDQTADGQPVWVGNVGRNGTGTRDHVLQVKYLLRQYPRIDLVIALVGATDMASALREGWDYRPPLAVTEPKGEEAQLHHAFVVVPDSPHLPWFKATGWWRLARRLKMMWQRHRHFTEGDAQAALDRVRASRASATLVDSLPPLEQPLGDYRRNLNAMVDLAARTGTQLVFVTQPSAWRPEMSAAEAGRLWFGWIGTDWSSARQYYTTGALSRAIAAYNDVLIDVCRTRRLECVDAASQLPHDSTAYVDDMHFSERGSHLLAAALVTALRDRPPFRAEAPRVSQPSAGLQEGRSGKGRP